MSSENLFILDKALTKKYIDELIDIDLQTSKLLGDKYGNPWTINNFLYDLEKKFSFSIIYLQNNKVLGFLIVSKWLNNIHVHRAAMIANLKSKRKVQIFKALYSKVNETALNNSIHMMTAIVPVTNESTWKFYLREGWNFMHDKNLQEFIRLRKMDAHIEEDNILVDNKIIPGDPHRQKVLSYNYNYF